MVAEQTVRAIPVLDYEPAPEQTAVRRIKRAIIPLIYPTLGALIGMAIGWLIAPVSYTSAGRFYVTPPTNNGTPATLTTTFLNTQAITMTSLAAIKHARGTTEGAVVTQAEWDEAIIQSEVDRKTDTIWLTVTHKNPDTAKLIASSLMSYVDKLTVDSVVLEFPMRAGILRPHRHPAFILTGGTLGALAVILIRRTGQRTKLS